MFAIAIQFDSPHPFNMHARGHNNGQQHPGSSRFAMAGNDPVCGGSGGGRVDVGQVVGQLIKFLLEHFPTIMH